MIAIGCDHGGYDLKEKVKAYLEGKGITVADKGCYNKDSVDYPAFGHAVAKAVANGECEKGIVICTTGIGISIAANKHKGIRAALCGDVYSAKFTRLHNDANVLCLGALVTGAGVCKMIADTFLSTEFEGGRHQRRVDMLTAIEEEQ